MPRCWSRCGPTTANASGSIVDAERRGMPVYVLSANTVNQMERFLAGLFDLASNETIIFRQQPDRNRDPAGN